MRRIIAVLLIGTATLGFFAASRQAAGQVDSRVSTPKPVDHARARRAGIRKLVGQHLILVTDLPSDAEVDRLPEVFDQAVPQWAKYFGLDQNRTHDWQAQAYLIKDRERFDAMGLMPAGHDAFVHGISLGWELWLYDQPTPYYRRHLLLHEGTHVFMATLLGGCGPGWYMEGMAELLATHRLDEQTGRLTLRTMPRTRQEVPMLGRIKLIADAREAERALGLPAVLEIDNRRQLGNESYAWSWAAARFLDSHPRYRERFRRLPEHVLDPNFNQIVRRTYAADWKELLAEWQAYASTLEHGYDFERMAIDFERGTPIEPNAGRQRVTIAADRGWQSSRVWLDAGRSYRVTASGRYQIAAEESDGVQRPWPSEPGGVTIEYHEGLPLGMLLGAIERGAEGKKTGAATAGGFASPFAIGLDRTLTPEESGTLYLRVNDSGGRLDDNRGDLTVVIEEESSHTAGNADPSVDGRVP